MKQWNVQRKEIYFQDVLIDAEDAEHAIEFVAEGDGIEQELHYARTADTDEWKVFEAKL